MPNQFSNGNITTLPPVAWHLSEVLAIMDSSMGAPGAPGHLHQSGFPGDFLYLHAAISAHYALQGTFLMNPRSHVIPKL